MLNDIGLFQLASLRARHASERHVLIAENLANADTPGYSARDLEPFDAALRRQQARGEGRSFEPAQFRVRPTAGPGARSPNGNSVSLEDQMARSAAATRDHEAATLIYSKAIDFLRAALGRQR